MGTNLDLDNSFGMLCWSILEPDNWNAVRLHLALNSKSFDQGMCDVGVGGSIIQEASCKADLVIGVGNFHKSRWKDGLRKLHRVVV